MERLRNLGEKIQGGIEKIALRAMGVEVQNPVGREEKIESITKVLKRARHTVRIVCGKEEVEEHLEALKRAGIAEKSQTGEIKIKPGIKVEILAG